MWDLGRKAFGDYAELTLGGFKETPKVEKKDFGCIVGIKYRGAEG